MNEYAKAAARNVTAIAFARRIVAHERNYAEQARNLLAWALVEIDDAMRAVETDDR